MCICQRVFRTDSPLHFNMTDLSWCKLVCTQFWAKTGDEPGSVMRGKFEKEVMQGLLTCGCEFIGEEPEPGIMGGIIDDKASGLSTWAASRNTLRRRWRELKTDYRRYKTASTSQPHPRILPFLYNFPPLNLPRFSVKNLHIWIHVKLGLSGREQLVVTHVIRGWKGSQRLPTDQWMGRVLPEWNGSRSDGRLRLSFSRCS